MLESSEIFNGLEIFIGGKAMDTINTWRRRYDPTVLDVQPHITLAYPPFVPFEQWEKVKPQIVSCLAGYEPFRVVFQQAGTFTGDSPIDPNVLWLKPEDGGVITRMRLDLEKKFPAFVPPMPFPYVPHLSIGFIQGNEALQRALVVVQKSLKPFEITVKEIVYEALDDQAGLHFFDHIPLGAPC